MIKYHPILFSTLMVQGLLEDRKTKTRRTKGLEKVNLNPNDWKFEAFGTNPDNENDKNLYAYFTVKGTETWMHLKCPCNVGDVLWVRENFYTFSNCDHLKPSILKSLENEVFYNADLENDYISKPVHRGKTRPNIFLPKEYARIFLKIKSIHCEQLQTISSSDSVKEGVLYDTLFGEYICYLCEKSGHTGGDSICNDGFYMTAYGSFKTLWQSINGKESWDWNPFVWVYEFSRIEKPLDFI
jgi:hypothetical protein